MFNSRKIESIENHLKKQKVINFDAINILPQKTKRIGLAKYKQVSATSKDVDTHPMNKRA